MNLFYHINQNFAIAWKDKFESATTTPKRNAIPSKKQRLINVFVNSVYIDDNKLIIFFNYKDDEKIVDFETAKETASKTPIIQTIIRVRA